MSKLTQDQLNERHEIFLACKRQADVNGAKGKARDQEVLAFMQGVIITMNLTGHDLLQNLLMICQLIFATRSAYQELERIIAEHEQELAA